ncbi:MAG: hypothetical protein SGJ27_19195 [Candidatus Melainabacteria bacterium]|nr:hypothetical protein [Candidatus Melainabacteria bacterium]
MPLPVTSLILPLTVGSLFVSSNLQAAARSGDSDHLARLTNRMARVQRQNDQRQLRLDSSAAQTPDRAGAWAANRQDVRRASREQRLDQTIQLSAPVSGINSHIQTINRRSEFLSDSGRLRNVSRGAELDLTSDSRSIKLGEHLFNEADSVTIHVGGEEKTLSAGTFVTPAEYVALNQKLASGSQDLVVGTGGNAVDGLVSLNLLSDAGRKIEATSLVIPESVEAFGDFANHGDFRLTGQLNNFGSVYALSTRNDVTVAKIGARSIYNAEGALISSAAPANLSQQFGSLNQAVSLELTASDSFVNLGQVSSSKDLTIASLAIVNAGGNISAKGNVTLNSAIVDNYGAIASDQGNVNFATLAPSAINVYNEGGSIEALNGAINIRNSGFIEKFDTTLNGGDWLSTELNIDGGGGIVNVDAGLLTGAVVCHAGSAYISSATPNLHIKEMVTTGDPVIKNTLDVTQGSLATGGAPLAIIAGGSINISFGAVINTDNGAGAAGDILMVAGAAFEDETTPGHIGQTWITGASGFGGNVNAEGTFITANGSTNGGDITIIAFPSSVFAGGDINSSEFEATGGAGGANGNVTIIGRSASVFSVDTNGAGTTAGTGDVLISSWSPQLAGGSEVRVIDDGTAASGTVISGSFIPLTVLTAEPNPDDAIVDSINAGGTFTFESIDDTVVFGTVNANLVNITAREAVDFKFGSSINAQTDVNIRALGINDAASGTIDPSTVFDVSTAGGDISIIQERDILNLTAGGSILATEGNILIQNSNVIGKKGKKTDFLNIFDNVTIFADASISGLGNVTIATGALPALPSIGKPFKQAFFDEDLGGTIFWGKKISNLEMTVTAKGADVIFSNLLKKSSLTIGFAVDIIADPPVALPASLSRPHAEKTPQIPQISALQTSYSDPTAEESSSNRLQLPGTLNAINDLSVYSSLLLKKTASLNEFDATSESSSATTYGATNYAIDAFVWSDATMGLTKAGSVVSLQGKAVSSSTASATEKAEIRKGSVLFASDRDAEITTPLGKVEIGAGSVALLLADENTFAVYDLHDGKKGTVKVTVADKVIHLSPGNCVVSAKGSSRKFNEVNPLETVGYRRITETIVAGGMKLFSSEFSTIHAASAIKPLMEIMRSNHPLARKLAAKYIKTSAVLMMLGRKNFEFHPKTSVTACNTISRL